MSDVIIYQGAAIPFSFSRQNGQPLDVTSVMRTLADITTYAANAEKKYVPYEGQTIACLEDKMLYILELKNGVLVPKQSGGVKLIKRDDNVELTDDAAFSALRSVKEIEDRAISRTKRDTAAEVIEFAKGLTAAYGKTTVSGDGKITTLNLLVQVLADTYDLNVSHVATMMRTIIKDYVSSEAFTPGLMGEGFKISKALNGDWNLEVDNIVVRKVMTIFEMVISKVRSVNGGLVISPANGRIKSVAETTGSPAYYVIGIEGDMQFVVDDLVRCQVFSNGHAKHYWVRVASISGDSILVLKSEFTNGVVPAVGDDLVQMGNATNTARQGVIYLTASEDGKPRISVLDGVNSTSTVGKNKVILGCLDGITDADFPAEFQPSGYGLYAMNVFLKGIFVLRSGKSVEGEIEAAQNAAATAQAKADMVTRLFQEFTVAGGLFESKITETKTYADNKASDAKSQAITAAASDATTKANSAVTTALGNTITEIGKVEVGGRNILRGSKCIVNGVIANVIDNGSVLSVDNTTTYNGEPTMKVVGVRGFSWSNLPLLEPGVEYTISMMVKSDRALTGILDMPITIQIPAGSGQHKGLIKADSSLTTEWKQIYLVAKNTSNDPQLLRVYLYSISDRVVNVAWVKVEKGNKATDWTPAPEDVTADAQTRADAAKVAAITDAASKYPTKTEVSTSITQLSNSISLKADKTEVTGLGTRVSAAEAKITPDAIKLTVKSQTDTIAADAARSAVDVLQVGGRNLLLNSSNGDDWSGWIGDNTFKVSAQSTGESAYIWSTHFQLDGGQEYTLSFDSKNDENIINRDVFILSDSHGSNGAIWSNYFANSTDWERIVFTFWAPSSFTGVKDVRVRIDHNGSTDGSLASIWARNLKLEKGNKATDWTPAPEDVAADTEAARLAAVAAQTTANNAASTANAAKSRLDDWSADGSISPTEKLTLTQEQKALLDEKTQIVADAAKYAVSSTAYVTAYTNYNVELTYHTTVTPEVIAIRANFATYQTAYYTAKQTILNAISAAAKKYAEDQADNAKNLATNYADTYFSTKSDFTILSNQIAAKVSQTDFNSLGQRVSSAETSITQQAGQIDLKASKSDLGALTGRVTSTEAELRVHATEIGLKVTAGDVSAGMTITANKITLFGKEFDLTGKITFSSMAPDAQGKITTAQGTADRAITDAANSLVTSRNNIAAQLGYGSYDAMSAAAIAGKTIINGGMIRTELLDARAIVTGALVSEVISATNITTGKLTVTDGAKIAGMTVINGKLTGGSIEITEGARIGDLYITNGSFSSLSTSIVPPGTSWFAMSKDYLSYYDYNRYDYSTSSCRVSGSGITIDKSGSALSIKSAGSHRFMQRAGEEWNAPGVLWCGRCNNGGTVLSSWGDGTSGTVSVTRSSTGYYRFSHNLGHTQYYVTAMANVFTSGNNNWALIARYVDFSANSFRISFKNLSDNDQDPMEFMVVIYGRNKW